VDIFYAAWVEDLLHGAAEALLDRYLQDGKGDYFRVLYGRLCEDMALPVIAEALGLTKHQAQHAYKHARKELARLLEERVQDHIRRYCDGEEATAEFATEWGNLHDYLRARGHLGEAVRRAFDSGFPAPSPNLRPPAHAALSQIQELLRQPTPEGT
jgi:hypothetical protein